MTKPATRPNKRHLPSRGANLFLGETALAYLITAVVAAEDIGPPLYPSYVEAGKTAIAARTLVLRAWPQVATPP